jgi:hypothetical protein
MFFWENGFIKSGLMFVLWAEHHDHVLPFSQPGWLETVMWDSVNMAAMIHQLSPKEMLSCYLEITQTSLPNHSFCV